MGFSTGRKPLLLILAAIFSVLLIPIGASQPTSTQCTANPNSPACQQPVFTDNQDTYRYDLRASWILNDNNAPTESSITMLHGGQAGNIGNLQSDTASEDQKTEHYIQNPGEAGTQNWGQGQLQNALLQTQGETSTDQLSDYLVNNPNNITQGMCGDGKQNTGDSHTCPSDNYLPDRINGVSGETPSRTIYFDERITSSYELPTVISDFSQTLEGDVNQATDYYNTGGGYEKHRLETSTQEVASGTHYELLSVDDTEGNLPNSWAGEPEPIQGTYYTIDSSDGYDATTVCTSEPVNTVGNPIASAMYTSTVSATPDTENIQTSVDSYDASNSPGNIQEDSETLDITVNYNTDYTGSEPVHLCLETTLVFRNCEGDPEIDPSVDCNQTDTSNMYEVEEVDVDHIVGERDWTVNYIDYDLNKTSISEEEFPGENLELSFDEGGTYSVDIGETGASESVLNKQLETNPHQTGTDHLTDGTLIHEQTATKSQETFSGSHTYITDSATGVLTDAVLSGEIDDAEGSTTTFTGSNKTNPEYEVCTDLEPTEFYNNKPEIEQTTAERYTNALYYDARDSQFSDAQPFEEPGGLGVEISKGNQVSSTGAEQVYTCNEFRQVYTDCDGTCDEETFDSYNVGLEFGLWRVQDATWTVDYTDFDFNTRPIWDVRQDIRFQSEHLDTSFDGGINDNSNQISTVPGYHAYSEDSQGANDPSVSYNEYEIEENSNRFDAERTDELSVNPDGSTGRNNGIVAYNEGEGIVGSTEGFRGSELLDGSSANFIGTPSIDCPADKCIATVNVSAKDSGWTSASNSYTLNVEEHPVTASAGACETYNQLSEESDTGLYCSPGPNFDVCGAYENEDRATVKGPDINTSGLSQNLAHYEACIDTTTQQGECILPDRENGTTTVSEGYVANIAPYYNSWNYPDYPHAVEKQYQSGGNAPDWSVCLDRDQSSTEGEWYDLDNPEINQYLRENEDRLGLSTQQKTEDIHDINYYYTRNPSPQHNKYNPRGGEKGVSLIADCGPLMDGCGNNGTAVRAGVNAENGTYFGFLQNNATITEYHPQGEHSLSFIQPMFNGTVNYSCL